MATRKATRRRAPESAPSARPDGGPMIANDSAPATQKSETRPVVAVSAPPALSTVRINGRDWSVYQAAIFRDVAEGHGHTVVQARAGSGKTTTIVESFKHVPAGLSVLMVAFNKKIAEELQARAPAGVTVSTLHSYGFVAVRNAFGSVRLDNRKLDSLIVARVGDSRDTLEYRKVLARGVSLAKGMLAENMAQIGEIIDAFDLEVGEAERDAFCRDAIEILARCKADTRAIDFDDMIWFPVVHNLRVRRFDRVFIDETQDLNACQIQLALRACRDDGRICAVGDDRQAIYGFRGADSNAMGRVIEALGAKVLPLSVTYRCASKIVDVAKVIVADYEAAPNAPEGEVLDASTEEMKRLAKPGDFILSRSNAPIVSLCLSFLRAGVPASVAGRDVGAGLIALIHKSGKHTVGDLTEWIDAWTDREIARIQRRKRDADTSGVEDKAECIHALCEGAGSVAEVIAKIETLFSDSDDARRVVLSTTHKAKGLERDRAFVLASTYRVGRNTEESNLWYVAVTRARKSLYIVG